MWVQVHVRVDAIAAQSLRPLGRKEDVVTSDGVPGLQLAAWVESEKLPPVPPSTPVPAREYKLARLVVWPDPNGAVCVTLFGAWSPEPGNLIADKWQEGDVQ
jgi:hypothetical protein